MLSGGSDGKSKLQSGLNGTAHSYDNNGNLTGDGTNTYSWDARNHLSTISQGRTTVGSFVYDGFGRRMKKTIGGTVTQFLYDGLNPVQELNGSNGVVANLLTGLGIDERFTRTDASGAMSFLTDALGSTIGLVNAGGSIATSYTYDPFGATTVGGSANANPYQFTGRENDGTGLYFYRARYYSPTFQRFASQDPIGFAARDFNIYRYVGDDPTNFTDWFGLCWVYHQTTGEMDHVDSNGTIDYSAGGGYSGYGLGLNNPAMQDVQAQQHEPMRWGVRSG